jgi:hypothetical protein
MVIEKAAVIREAGNFTVDHSRTSLRQVEMKADV